MSLRIAYLAHRIPYPPNKGDKIRSFHHVRHLAQRHDVSVFAFVDDAADEDGAARLREYCKEVVTVRLHKPVALARGAAWLAAGRSLSEGYYRSAALRRAIARAAAREPFDVAWAFSSVMAQYLDAASTPRRIVDCVDVDSEKWRQFGHDSRGPLRLAYRLEAVRLRAFEARLGRRADRVLFVSKTEADLFRSFCHNNGERLLKNGLNTLRQAAHESASPRLVMPAKAGIHVRGGVADADMDSRFRGNDTRYIATPSRRPVGLVSTNEPFGTGSPPYQGGVRGGFATPHEQPPPSPLLGKEGVHWPNIAAPRGSGPQDEREGSMESGRGSALRSQSEDELVEACDGALRQADWVGVIPNGVDTDYFRPVAVQGPTSKVQSAWAESSRPEMNAENNGVTALPPTVLFTGALDYRPNIDAVLFFVREVLPLVRREIPDARFLAVRHRPAPTLLHEVDRQAGALRIAGSVPDIRPYFAEAGVYVAPLRLGRGVQNKVLEAMAMQLPVVASPLAVAGLAAEDGTHVLVADPPEQFAAAVVSLFRNPQRAADLSANAGRLISERYTWEANLELLDEVLAARSPFAEEPAYVLGKHAATSCP